MASATTEYSPGISPTTVKVPAEEVTVWDTTPVDGLVMVILAWLITAWLAYSRTALFAIKIGADCEPT